MAEVTTDERLNALTANVDRFIEEGRRGRAELEAAMKDLSRRMGKFSNALGEFAEDMVLPAAGRLFQARGIPVHQTSRNTIVRHGDEVTEFDILVVNADHVMAVEVKAKPKVSDVDKHLWRLANAKMFMPQFRTHKIMGAIAGLTVDEAVARYAYRQGLFVLGQSGETVVILNDDRFEPKVW